VSVILCTWNRAALLEGALEALTAQEEAPPHEVIVVDNKSTDGTREVVRRFAASHPQVRYAFEPRQGLAHSRNSGFSVAQGDIVVFTDDDVRVDRTWLRSISDACARYPDAACIGGPVLPAWSESAPAWLSERHWSPLGVQHHSDEPFRVDAARPVCLIGANLAFRRHVLERVGAFDPSVQRTGDGVGSTEDHEYHIRLWASGQHGMYEPAMRTVAVITPDRVTKRYHRRWHFGHGRHLARMNPSEMPPGAWNPFGVPSYLLRQAFGALFGWTGATLHAEPSTAFERESELWSTAGFIYERALRQQWNRALGNSGLGRR
jgi:glycosyltransferase involved in cell wall biosynthesis